MVLKYLSEFLQGIHHCLPLLLVHVVHVYLVDQDPPSAQADHPNQVYQADHLGHSHLYNRNTINLHLY